MMKKYITFIFAVCLMAAVLCITAFAADAPAAGEVIRVSGLNKDGISTVLSSHKNHAEGWGAAIAYAQDSDKMVAGDYERIVIDFYADWDVSANNGVFSDRDGYGFENNTLYIPQKARITVNLNGHTINRGLVKYENDGEVLYIDKSADVIINNGTITGGYSCSGAGGIHICAKANVTLNNVDVVRNAVEDDDGAGIAVYENARLTMNNGSISYNVMDSTSSYYPSLGALYSYKATVVLNSVSFAGNVCKRISSPVAICNAGSMTLNLCTFQNNGHAGDDTVAADAIIYSTQKLILKDCRFKNNGTPAQLSGTPSATTVLDILGETEMSGCKFEENDALAMIHVRDKDVKIYDCMFYDNGGEIVLPYGLYKYSTKISFYDCYFFNNGIGPLSKYTFRGDYRVDLRFYACELRNSTFSNKEHIKIFQSSDETAASIFGEGSLVSIIAFVALIASIASISVNVNAMKTKKATSVDKTDENDIEK